MNLRVFATHSGMTESDDRVEGLSSTVTTAVFGVPDDIDELGDDVVDGFSEPIDVRQTAQSLADRSGGLDSESDQTDDDESDDDSSIALDEYAIRASSLPRIVS